jgi:hypothetical protein
MLSENLIDGQITSACPSRMNAAALLGGNPPRPESFSAKARLPGYVPG